MAPRWRPTLLPAGFGGRLRGKGPHPHRERDLAAQPTLLRSAGLPVGGYRAGCRGLLRHCFGKLSLSAIRCSKPLRSRE
jgi:hypothetical protein